MPEARAENVTVIAPTRGWSALGLRDVWEYRELLYFFFWRELKANYRQMALGPLWMIIKPIVATIIFTVIFGKLAGLNPSGLPGPLFFYAGLLPWYLFSGAASNSAGSLTSNMHLISKVYFPRLIAPLYSALAGLVDFAISFAILLILMLAYGVAPHLTTLLLPVFLILALGTALAVGLWLSALSVQFRDVGFALGYMLQLWMYASPVIYPLSKIPERWHSLYLLNPMADVVEGFRWALYGPPIGQAPDAMLALSFVLTGAALVAGAYYFRHTERTIVDLM